MTKLSDATRNKLKTVSTATVATALYKRGFRVQMIQDVHPLSADQPTMVGEAFTLRYMPAREDLNKLEVFRDRSHPQRKAGEDCPPGVGRRYPGDAADAARRRRRGHRRWIPRCGRNRKTRLSRVSPPPQRADQ